MAHETVLSLSPHMHTRPIHLHGMASGPAAGCVPLVSAALMIYSEDKQHERPPAAVAPSLGPVTVT